MSKINRKSEKDKYLESLLTGGLAFSTGGSSDITISKTEISNMINVSTKTP